MNRRRPMLKVMPLVVVAALAVPAFAQAADTKAPTRPPLLKYDSSTVSSVSFSWSAASDNVAVTGYRFYRNGTHMATTTARTAAIQGLACNTTYLLSVVSVDAAGNRSLPSVIFAKTSACAPATPPCPSPTTVLGLLLEHKITYGCGWPSGSAAREALGLVRTMLATRSLNIPSWRAKKWHGVVLSELDAARNASGAWTSTGKLQTNAAGLAVQYRIGRAIRLLHWANPELYEASKPEKWALTAISWYIIASEFNVQKAAGASPSLLASTEYTIRRGDTDFFSSNVYRAWGRYRQAWQRLAGV